MQTRNQNSHAHQPTTPRNPIIIAFDRQWRELFRKELSAIDCMAYGVREDYENGYRGIKLNLATSRTTHRIHAWATPSI